MPAAKDPAFERWWPLPRSLDLVRAPIARVATFLESEVARYVPGEPLESDWPRFDSIDALFGSVDELTNVGTTYFALPTHSEWTVLWNNSLLCNGYSALCSNLARVHGVDAIHWESSDVDGPVEAGTLFAYFYANEAREARHVYCCRDGKRWVWHERGAPLAAEPTSGYEQRLKRNRMNESLLMEMLAHLGARPWRESFYALAEAPCFRLRRKVFPDTITRRAPSEVVAPVSEKTGCRPVVIHHARKPTEECAGGRYSIRGSSAIYDACDSVYVFSAAKGEPVLVEHVKAALTANHARRSPS